MLKKFLSVIMSIAVVSGTFTFTVDAEENDDFSNLVIKYTEPTDVKGQSGGWTYAGIPIGNGKIGAKIYGGVDKDVYQLNDASFWSGGPEYTDVYDESGARKKALDNTRTLLEGDLTDWDNITAIENSAKNMVGNNVAGSYLPVGNMIFDFGDDTSYSNYSRTLDLDTATVTTSYVQNGITYTRTAFASYPDNVIVVKLESSGEGNLDMDISLSFPDEKVQGEGNEILTAVSDNEYSMSWRAPVITDTDTWSDNYGTTVESRVKIADTDGQVSSSDEGLSLTDANEAVIIYSSETSYNGYDKNPTVGSGEEKDYKTLLNGYMENATEKGYDELYKRHIEDYQNLFHRLWVNIEGDSSHVLAYQYKRYEMISCNRSGDFFRMGYGMWNPQMKPTSWGNHYMNENVVKQNSFLEAANLPEMVQPVLKWLTNLSENGAKTAEYDFGFRGWVAPHHSDIWAVTSLQADGAKRTEWAIFPVGGMWTNLLAWEHYLYNMDDDYLKDTAYPLIEGAAAFACDWLVEREFTADEITGEPGTYLVTSPSTSAENSYGLNYGIDYKPGLFEAVSVGTTQDMTIVRETFEEYIEACNILGIENDLLTEVKDKYERLLPYQVHKDGELQEWAFEQMKPNNERDVYSTHRHASQLLGIWPYNSITEEDGVLFDAAKTALENRNSGARMPDKAAMWVRLNEPDKALDEIPTAKGDLIGQWADNNQNAFCEFIVQSQNGYIDLLPALPTKWKNGEIKGTRVRGNYELDIKWIDGQLEICTVYSLGEGDFPEIRLNNEILTEDDSRITFVKNPNTTVEAENISANISNISKNEDDTVRMDYTVKSEDNDTATKTTAYLAVYDVTNGSPVLCDLVSKNSKIYNTQEISETIRFDGSKYVADGKKYMFRGYVWKNSNMKPLCDTKELDNIEFELREIYNSASDFLDKQGPIWYYKTTTDNMTFTDMSTYQSDGYWQSDESWCRVDGIYIHPASANAVRTFKAPADGILKIKKSTVKAENSGGTRDGVAVKIVKQTADLSQTKQLYPQNSSDYREITTSEHIAGAEIPELTVEVKAGDTINFILNQCGENGRDGTYWTNELEFVR